MTKKIPENSCQIKKMWPCQNKVYHKFASERKNERTNEMTIFAMFVATKSKQTAVSVCLPITQCSKRINSLNSAINIVTLNYPYVRRDPAPANTSTKDEVKLDVIKQTSEKGTPDDV